MATMNPDLEQLRRYQAADLEIRELQRRTAEIPQEIADLDQLLDSDRKAVEDAEKRLEEARSRRKSLEQEVDRLKEKRSKSKSQLMEVKSNKEYQAMLNEIATAEKTIAAKEDDILEVMLEIDDLKEDLSAAQSKLDREKEMVEKRRAEMEAFGGQAEEKIDRLEGKKVELAALIPPDLMTLYHRIAEVHNGMAMAELRDRTCQACNVTQRPQLIAEIRSGQAIAKCESCKRILYYVLPAEKTAQSKTAQSKTAQSSDSQEGEQAAK
ncbi:MAG TPA: C4-type zinc ribbon domain-containing protein [Acidobacteriota bacterium]|nr:C4-type zinc ribbon domain-containing protein [Acidobacteriota bacterium]